jgi:hypothetical protein
MDFTIGFLSSYQKLAEEGIEIAKEKHISLVTKTVGFEKYPCLRKRHGEIRYFSLGHLALLLLYSTTIRACIQPNPFQKWSVVWNSFMPLR